jgi:hypothetical protein
MPRVDSSSKAPGHLREPVSFLPSLVEVIVSPDVLLPISFEAASPESVEASW